MQVFPGHHHIDQPALGDLKGNLSCSDAVQGQQPRHHLADSRNHHITRREIDRDVQLRVGTQQLAKLLEQALQDEVRHLANLPGVLRHRNEQVGTGQGAVRPAPAQQCFSPDTVAAIKVEDRLIQHLQLATANRAGQFGVQRLPLAHQQKHQEPNAYAQREAGRQQPPPDRRDMHAGAWADQHQLIFRVVGGHAVYQACLGDLQRITVFRWPGLGRRPDLRSAEHRNRPRAMVQDHQQAAARRQVDHIGQMPARGRDPEIPAPEHQRGAVFIGFGGGVEPIAVSRAFDVWRSTQRQPFLTRAIGADS
ncbi:hypothetical protein D3C87_1055220 [compost metagenome]